ncbi:Sensory box histidine kinase/response regulator [Enhygromyxa salina]|uniref:histidine kinase n=2 Tax=Enhygromyxa salina TaxID=215803 RepID=A0A0C2DIK6_9BACT|nr:Sensory box histidine kinase/response regulator [Enhygromyxa salina]
MGTWLVITVALYFNAVQDRSLAMVICIPVCATSWVFGLRGAIYAGLAALPLSLGMLALGSLDLSDVLRDPPTVVGHFMTVLVGLVIGYLSTLRTRLELETQRRTHSERAKLEAEMDAHMARADRLATIGALASGVAHEINNPLTYLLSNLEFAQDDLQQLRSAKGEEAAWAEIWERLRTSLEESREGVERIHKITRELQLFVRDRPGSMRSVDIRRVVEASIELSRGELEDGTKIEFQQQRVAPICGDGGKLTQVFVNLLTNAAQAIPPARGHGRIFVAVEPGEADTVIVTVTDDGVGMAPEVASKIFEPFFTTKAAGTGLGLSVAASVIRNHEGELVCESVRGRGTTFRVHLPSFAEQAKLEPGLAGASTK